MELGATSAQEKNVPNRCQTHVWNGPSLSREPGTSRGQGHSKTVIQSEFQPCCLRNDTGGTGTRPYDGRALVYTRSGKAATHVVPKHFSLSSRRIPDKKFERLSEATDAAEDTPLGRDQKARPFHTQRRKELATMSLDTDHRSVHHPGAKR